MKNFIKKYFSHSPFLCFLPIGIFYVLIVLKFHTSGHYGDETRYLGFADNLLNGFYSPPPPAIYLWSGPGYPLMLLPFVWLKLPLISITLLNACFQYFSVAFLFFTLKNYVSHRIVVIITSCWALYYPAYLWEMPTIYTESLTIFLITLICYGLTKAFALKDGNNSKWVILSGCLIGFLVLTKIIFGYVLMVLLVCAIGYCFFRMTLQMKKILLCLTIALLTTIPYLMYTYSLTSKLFYWGNSGGENLYWMTTPYQGEYGEWHGAEFFEPKNANTSLVKNHYLELMGIDKLNGVEKDEAYKSIAGNNIKNHPIKYARNCLANITRLLFDAPTYFVSPTDLYLLRIFPTCCLLPFIIITFFVTVLNFSKLTSELKLLFLFVILYFSFTILVSAYNRQFYIMVPVILIFVAYAFEKFIKVKVEF